MQFTEAQLSQWLAGFLWPLMRIGAMLMVAPIFSVRQVPVRLRLLLAVLCGSGLVDPQRLPILSSKTTTQGLVVGFMLRQLARLRFFTHLN